MHSLTNKADEAQLIPITKRSPPTAQIRCATGQPLIRFPRRHPLGVPCICPSQPIQDSPYPSQGIRGHGNTGSHLHISLSLINAHASAPPRPKQATPQLQSTAVAPTPQGHSHAWSGVWSRPLSATDISPGRRARRSVPAERPCPIPNVKCVGVTL